MVDCSLDIEVVCFLTMHLAAWLSLRIRQSWKPTWPAAGSVSPRLLSPILAFAKTVGSLLGSDSLQEVDLP